MILTVIVLLYTVYDSFHARAHSSNIIQHFNIWDIPPIANIIIPFELFIIIPDKTVAALFAMSFGEYSPLK